MSSLTGSGGLRDYVSGRVFFQNPIENYKKDDDTQRLLEDQALSSMEEGTGHSSAPEPDPDGTVRIPTEVIKRSARLDMLEPDPAALPAAGDPKRFAERFESLLRKQYEDKDGHSITTIGLPVYDILSKEDLEGGIPSIIDSKTASDVGLTVTDPKVKTVIAAMDRTQTKMGRGYFQATLTRPSADINVVKRNQNVIRVLIGNKVLLGQLEEELKKLPEGERNLLSCRDTRKQLPGSTTSLYYTIHPRVNGMLNMSPLALDVSALGTTFKKVTAVGMQAASAILLPIYACSEVSHGVLGTETPQFLEGFAGRFTAATPIGVAGGLAIAADIPLVNAVVALAAGAYSLMSVESTYDWLKADSSILPLMRDVLSSIATHYKGMKAIHAILVEHPEITQNLKHFQKLDDFIRNTKGSEELRVLFGALESCSFNPNNKYLFRPGEVLLVWELLHSGAGKKKKGALEGEKKDMAPGDKIRAVMDGALIAMGEIDAFTSIATLIQESEDSSVSYCLPSFVESDGPVLHFKGLWHPGVGVDNAVANDISLGSRALSKGAILSGPNTGGKTTFAQAAAIAAITARMGFCAATSAEMSDFGYIRTSMDIQGSVGRGESNFSAQCKVLADILSDVEKLPERTHSFVLLDEPCSQTNSEQGSRLARATAVKLSKLVGNTSMIITHFRNIPESIGDKPEESGELSYKNYRMEGKGSFRLLEGISPEAENNAFDVAREFGMGEEVVGAALKYGDSV